jgi:hypothetical protein
MAISGFTAVRVPGPLAIKRDSLRSLSNDDGAMDRGVRQVYRAVLERHPASPDVKALAQARLDEFKAIDERRSGGVGKVAGQVRKLLARATRGPRIRWAMRSTPPPGVAEAFPQLGRGRPARADRAR